MASGAVFEAFEGADLGESTFYHGHSYGGNALACAVALRHLQLIDEWKVLDQVTAVAERLAARLADSVAGLPGVARRPPAWPDGGGGARPSGRVRSGGGGGCAPAPWGAGCCSDRSATWSWSCPR